MGSLHFTLRTLALECQRYTKAWQRSYSIKTIVNKRCPSAGSCAINFCAKVRPKTSIKELREVKAHPGNSFCMDSTAFWGYQCLFPGRACLFYKWYTKPRTRTIYEVIGCNSWMFGIQANFQLDANGQSAMIEAVLHPGRVIKWKNMTLSPIALTNQPAPILNADFLFDGQNIAMVKEPLSEAFYCRSNEEA